MYFVETRIHGMNKATVRLNKKNNIKEFYSIILDAVFSEKKKIYIAAIR